MDTFHEAPSCSGHSRWRKTVLFQCGQRTGAFMRVARDCHRKVIAAMFSLSADDRRNPPYGRVIEQQALDTTLQRVDEVVVPADMG
jgi:hypothetical protein